MAWADGFPEVVVHTTLMERDAHLQYQAAKTGDGGAAAVLAKALISGDVKKDADYLVVDDHVGLGGTIANLKGHIETNGGAVILVTTLTESRESRRVALTLRTLIDLKDKHGAELEEYWQNRFGHGLDRLTEAEAGYLLRTQNVDRIRDRIHAASGEGLSPEFPDDPAGGGEKTSGFRVNGKSN
ncbi:MAG TPA: hypothetical protein ENI69_02455 [Rhodospirillales bacterium]|nr:hypothetical protein [Rhodospirillales bacterium]